MFHKEKIDLDCWDFLFKKIYIRNEFAQNISNKYYTKFWTSDEEYIDKSFLGLKKETISYYTACTIDFNSPKSSFNYSSPFSHSNQNNKNYVICVREKE